MAVPLLLTVSLAACGDDDDDDTAAAGDATTTTAAAEEDEQATEPAGSSLVNVAESDLGEILVDRAGMTLYLFTQDTGGASACTEGCAETWPPLLADGAPSGGEGIDASLLGTITRDDGTMQVTYNGRPLYTYAADNAPGDTNGQGVGDVWYAVSPAGEAIS